MNKKNIIIAILTGALSLSLVYSLYNRDYNQIMAVTGATPLAIAREVPDEFSLTVTGLTKKGYHFSGKALNAFAKTRIRTRQIDPQGNFEGTYIYYGITLYSILEGIAPKKAEDAPFDRPLDMIVKISSTDGKQALFSYGELTMTNDCSPVVLAYYRQELLPSKDPEKYTKNVHKGTYEALSLICTRDSDTSRYIDKVSSISLEVLPTPDDMLPVMRKGESCNADSIVCIDGNKGLRASYSGLDQIEVKNWIRVGHGRGYKGVSSASGYPLRSFLRKNFTDISRDSFFLFVACDGYRCLFSGYEIFDHEDGNAMILATQMDNKNAHGGTMLAPTKDYFVDRDIWGLSHVVHLQGGK